MLNKISNTASKADIEHAFSKEFDYGSIYSSQLIIDGLKESSVTIITSMRPEKIQFGIWGILPQGYKDNWKSFQSHLNTLETPVNSLKNSDWLLQAAQDRRCLIIVTGYFTSIIKNNKIFPYFNRLKNQNIFCLAGLYNVLEDGFITVSIFSNNSIKSDEILQTPQPIVIDRTQYSEYLCAKFTLEKLANKSYEIDYSGLSSYQISNDFYTNKDYSLKLLQPQINEDFYH